MISDLQETEMPMMTIRKLSIILFFILLPVAARSQDDDFGVWTSLEARYGFSKRINLEVSGSFRTFQKSSKLDEVFAEAGVNYRLNKYLGFAASYRLTDRYEYDGGYYFRHKLFLSVRSVVPAGNFTFSGRAMIQLATKTFIEDESDLSPIYTGRFKLKASYNIPAFPVNPYIYGETFIPLSQVSGLTFGKNRFSGGAELKINKRNSIDLEYIFQRDFLPHLSNEHIISVNYTFKF
jgi:hypothetical protein